LVDEEIDRPLRKIEELDEGLRLEGAVFLEPKNESVRRGRSLEGGAF
jgi:hypothetical protein